MKSPALRGFVGGPLTLATAVLYLVLLSNGLHHSENLPVKFGFSLKIVPANIVQKLPSQRCSKPLFIAFFNFSHKWPTFAFADESGYTLGFAQRIAHSGSHGETGGLPSPGHNAALCCQRNCSVIPLDSAVLLYTYISRFSVDPNYQQREKIRQSCRINFIPNRFSFRFSTSRTNGPRLPSPPKAGTHSPFGKRSHTRAHTAKQGHSLPRPQRGLVLPAISLLFHHAFIYIHLEMSRNVQSGNTQNLKSMVIQRSFPKWSVAERRKTAAASNQAAVCACAHSRYFTGGSPSGLRV